MADDVLEGEVLAGDDGQSAVPAVRAALVKLPALDGLPLRMRVFVNRYMSNGFRGGAAALEAGYSPASAHVMATKLLRSPRVVAAIEAALESQGLARVKVLEGLGALALSDITDLVTWDSEGKAIWKPFDTLAAHVKSAITKVKVDPETGKVTEVEMGSKVAALTGLMKALKMEKANLEINAAGPVQVNIGKDDSVVL